MAIRLSVILVQSTPPTAAAGRTADVVVGELIGFNGIDVTLVGPLTDIIKSSTDRLTLDSLTGDVAVLDWQSPPEIMVALLHLGFSGQRTAHKHDPRAETVAANLRKIYAFDLTEFSGPEDILQALSGLNANRQVRTFSLGLSSESGSQQVNPPVRPAGHEKPTGPKHEQSLPEKNFGMSATHRPPVDASTRPERGESINLDDLLDQLDEMDP